MHSPCHGTGRLSRMQLGFSGCRQAEEWLISPGYFKVAGSESWVVSCLQDLIDDFLPPVPASLVVLAGLAS